LGSRQFGDITEVKTYLVSVLKFDHSLKEDAAKSAKMDAKEMEVLLRQVINVYIFVM
jgi:hypothetical protein